jgi:hypothetical protein
MTPSSSAAPNSLPDRPRGGSASGQNPKRDSSKALKRRFYNGLQLPTRPRSRRPSEVFDASRVSARRASGRPRPDVRTRRCRVISAIESVSQFRQAATATRSGREQGGLHVPCRATGGSGVAAQPASARGGSGMARGSAHAIARSGCCARCRRWFGRGSPACTYPAARPGHESGTAA